MRRPTSSGTSTPTQNTYRSSSGVISTDVGPSATSRPSRIATIRSGAGGHVDVVHDEGTTVRPSSSAIRASRCTCQPGPGGQGTTMETRTLGRLTVSAQGLGCMGMSEFYGTAEQTEAEWPIRRARVLGVTFLDNDD